MPISPVSGSFTVTSAVAVKLLPSVVDTVIVTLPAFFPITFPLLSTEAISESLLVQINPALSGVTVATKVSLEPIVNSSVSLFSFRD